MLPRAGSRAFWAWIMKRKCGPQVNPLQGGRLNAYSDDHSSESLITLQPLEIQPLGPSPQSLSESSLWFHLSVPSHMPGRKIIWALS